MQMGGSRILDRAAVALSAVCIVHCLAVPIVVAVLPIAAVSLDPDGHFHWIMLWLVVPTSFVGLLLGYRVHRRVDLIALGAIGLLVLVIAAYWGHSSWHEYVEVFVSVAGSLALAGAHVWNFREVKRLHVHG